jgi:hypothetical protein
VGALWRAKRQQTTTPPIHTARAAPLPTATFRTHPLQSAYTEHVAMHSSSGVATAQQRASKGPAHHSLPVSQPQRDTRVEGQRGARGCARAGPAASGEPGHTCGAQMQCMHSLRAHVHSGPPHAVGWERVGPSRCGGCEVGRAPSLWVELLSSSPTKRPTMCASRSVPPHGAPPHPGHRWRAACMLCVI